MIVFNWICTLSEEGSYKLLIKTGKVWVSLAEFWSTVKQVVSRDTEYLGHYWASDYQSQILCWNDETKSVRL